MQTQPIPGDPTTPWPLWQRYLFRFFCIYITLFLVTYPVYGQRPLIRFIGYAQARIVRSMATLFNDYFLHLGPQQAAGEGLSYRLAQVVLHGIVALIGMVAWSIAAPGQTSYNRANYWLKTAMRYFIAYICFLYGVIKVFALQMHYLRLTDLALPMGDRTPTRLLWHTIGYSPGYQMALGITEVLAGILLFYRRTVVAGALISLSIYAHVFLLNVSYNIPAKIASAHLVIMCLYMILADGKRLTAFFILNSTVLPESTYTFTGLTIKQANVRWLLKLIFLLNTAYIVYSNFSSFVKRNEALQEKVTPVPYGQYAVKTFIKNGDTLPVLANDSLAWKDFIFERGERRFVSVNSTDTVFIPYYTRGIFYYKADTVKNILECYKYKGRYEYKDSVALFTMKYRLSGKNRVEFWTKVRQDSLYFELIKSNYTYKLQKRPFSWLNEYTVDNE